VPWPLPVNFIWSFRVCSEAVQQLHQKIALHHETANVYLAASQEAYSEGRWQDAERYKENARSQRDLAAKAKQQVHGGTKHFFDACDVHIVMQCMCVWHKGVLHHTHSPLRLVASHVQLFKTSNLPGLPLATHQPHRLVFARNPRPSCSLKCYSADRGLTALTCTHRLCRRT